MKVTRAQLSRPLLPLGFTLEWERTDFHGIGFARRCDDPFLYSRIVIHRLGTRSEYISTNVEVSVVRSQVAVRDLIEFQYLDELELDKQNHETLLKTVEDRDRWLAMLKVIAPSVAIEFAQRVGATLLERTSAERLAVNRYVDCLGSGQPVDFVVSRLEQELTAEELTECARLERSPCVQMVQGGQEYYRAAILTILRYADEVEGTKHPFWGKVPIDHHPLMWRIQILVDRLRAPLYTT